MRLLLTQTRSKLRTMHSITFFLIAICAIASAANLLNDLPKCKRSDSKFNECLKNAIERALPLLERGIPELGIPSMQPMVVPNWLMHSVDVYPFEERYSKIHCFDHASSKIKSVESNITSTTFWMRLNGYAPKMYCEMEYEYINATLFNIDVTSSGNFSYIHYGYDFELTMKGSVSKQDSKNILHVTDATVIMNADRFDIVYQNSDPKLSKLMSDLSTENWLVLFNDIHSQYASIYADAYKRIANAVFSKIDFLEVFPQ